MNNKPNSLDEVRDILASLYIHACHDNDHYVKIAFVNNNPKIDEALAAIEQYIKSLVPEKKVDEQNIIGTIYGYEVRGEAIKGSYWAGYNAAIDKFNRRLDSSRREL